MAISEKRYTLSEFETLSEQQPERLLELIDGRIVEKEGSELRGVLMVNIGAELLQYLKSQSQIRGHAVLSVHYQPIGDEYNLRRPDVAFRQTDEPVSTENWVVGLPHFAVEIKSHLNSYDELRDKAHFYLANGARLVWLVYPVRRIVEVYFADGSSDLFTVADTLDGGEVLPGFHMPVRDVFEI